MNILDTVFWFRKGKESVTIVTPKSNITIFSFEDAEVSGIYNSEISFFDINNNRKYYKLSGADRLPKVARAYKKAGAKEKVLFSAVLEVEDYDPHRPTGKIVKVSKLK